MASIMNYTQYIHFSFVIRSIVNFKLHTDVSISIQSDWKA